MFTFFKACSSIDWKGIFENYYASGDLFYLDIYGSATVAWYRGHFLKRFLAANFENVKKPSMFKINAEAF